MEIFSLSVLTLVQWLFTFSWGWTDRYTGEVVRNAEFCGDLECRDFSIMKRFDGYELRHYPSSVWATVKIPRLQEHYWDDRSYEQESLQRLLDYMQGQNDKNLTIAMTAPLLKAHSKNSVLLSLMMPAVYSQNPPNPNDSKIFFFKSPSGEIYARSFDGFAYGFFGWSNYYKTELDKLAKYLHRDGQNFDDQTMYFTADYNKPWQLRNRHNEVWFRLQ